MWEILTQGALFYVGFIVGFVFAAFLLGCNVREKERQAWVAGRKYEIELMRGRTGDASPSADRNRPPPSRRHTVKGGKV